MSVKLDRSGRAGEIRTVVIATQEASLCSRWREAFDSRQWRVVSVQTRSALMAQIRDIVPDVCLVDLGLPRLHDGEGVALLHDLVPRTRLLVFTHKAVEAEARHLLGLGMHGYLKVSDPPDVISKAVDIVLAGDLWVERKTLVHLLGELQAREGTVDHAAVPLLDALTPREREIALRIAAGDSNRAIAERLGISERTVKAHLTSIFSKLGVKDRVQLAVKLNHVI